MIQWLRLRAFNAGGTGSVSMPSDLAKTNTKKKSDMSATAFFLSTTTHIIILVETILIHACYPPFNTPVQSPCFIFLISRILKLQNVIINISNHNSLSAPLTLLLQLIEISNPWSSHLHLHSLSYSLTFNLLKYPYSLHLYCSHKQTTILLYPFT